jgi:hypothetical protein
MALTRIPMPSPNYSTRGGASVRLVVLHTAEGATTIESLGNYFASATSGVSSHVGIDDTPNTVGEYVRADFKAWTQGNANPVAVSAELCAFAAWSRAEWDRHPAMLVNAAAWVAEECARFGIPIRSLSAAEAQGGAAGVCDHVDLGAWGGGHWDCGDGFPMDDVLALAAGKVPTAPSAPETQEDHNMIATDARTGGQWVAYRDGAVHTLGNAPFLGALNTADSPSGGRPCIGIAPFEDGYVLVVEFGSGEPGKRDPRSYHFRR